MAAWMGPAAQIAGGLIGSALQGKAANRDRRWQESMYVRQRQDGLDDYRQQRADQMADRDLALGDISQQFVRMRDAAQTAGFNPLSVLGTGTMVPGGSGIPGITPGQVPNASGVGAPLSSISMMVDGFTGLADIATGRTAQEAEQARLQTELMKIDVDRAKAGARTRVSAIAPSVRQTFGAPIQPGTNIRVSENFSTEPQTPVQVNKQGEIADVVETTQTFVNRDGKSTNVPVGPDMDEIVTGVIIEQAPKVRASNGWQSLGESIGIIGTVLSQGNPNYRRAWNNMVSPRRVPSLQ